MREEEALTSSRSSSPRKGNVIRIISWIVPLVGLGAAATAVWGPKQQPSRPSAAGTTLDPAEASHPAAPPAHAEMLAHVSQLTQRRDSVAISELIQTYGRLASDPGSVPARQEIVKAFLSHPDHEVGVGALLKAVEGDQTPRSQDPMWPFLVSSLGSFWDANTVARGRDLVLLESRQKPKEMLIESLTHVRPETLSPEERSRLLSDLIDLYPSLGPEQKPAVDQALTVLGGTDLVEILGRRGLSDDQHLQGAAEEKRALDEARRTLLAPGAKK